MEDYDISEMHNINNKIVMLIEDDEKIYEQISKYCEVIPLRFTYDISNFTIEYQNKTKSLFTYYYNLNNNYNNEIIRIKKHFKHFTRYPFITYINKKNKNYLLVKKMCNDLNIECVNNKKLFINKIKNNKKIFLIDGDGTLINSKGKISKTNINAIKKVKNNGDYAIICSARPRYYTIQLAKTCNLNNYIISSNGAEIYDIIKNRIIKAYYINKESLYNLIEKCINLNLRIVISIDSFEFVTKEIRNSSQILLDKHNYKKQLHNYKIKNCMIIDKDTKKVNLLKKEIKESSNITIIDEKNINDNYFEEWFTVGNKKSSKENGLINIAKYLQVPLKNVISIGNDYNDLSMFKKSGISFAVDNSDEEIKKIANIIVKSNDNNGVAEAINIIYK